MKATKINIFHNTAIEIDDHIQFRNIVVFYKYNKPVDKQILPDASHYKTIGDWVFAFPAWFRKQDFKLRQSPMDYLETDIMKILENYNKIHQMLKNRKK